MEDEFYLGIHPENKGPMPTGDLTRFLIDQLWVEEEIEVLLDDFFEHEGGMLLTYKLSPTTTGLFIDGNVLKGTKPTNATNPSYLTNPTNLLILRTNRVPHEARRSP
jgi:hypothetical protein